MKTQMISLLFGAALIVACDGQSNTDDQRSVERLERFVDSVETEVSAGSQENWAEIEREYKRLRADADDAWKNAKGEEKTRLDKLEDRYDKIEADIEMHSEKMSAESKRHMNNAEGWFSRTADNVEEGTEEAADDVEEGLEESMEWLEENYEKLEDGTKRQYDKIRQRWNERS